MKLTFRQGLVKYSKSLSVQAFLLQNGTTVDLSTTNGPAVVSFAHGDSDYLIEENISVTSAWVGPFTPAVNYWLYWDIDLITGERSFGHTLLEPLVSSQQPSVPVEDQHWFDTFNTKMNVFKSGVWIEVVRVFAAQYDGINFFTMGIGLPSFEFAGTQVGITNVLSFSGKIIFDDNGNPIKRANKEFFTTESQFFATGSSISSVRLEATVNVVKANETLPKYHVVKYVDEDLVELADYADTDTTVLGIVTEDINITETGNVVVDGIVTNPDWDWQNIGVKLWVESTGQLTENDPNKTDNITYPQPEVPVGKVLSRDTIIFQQGMGGLGKVGPAGPPGTTSVASNFEVGISKLSVASSTPLSPIVVGDNDPRMTDSRNPLPHFHPADDISFTPYLTISSNNVQDAIQELEDSKLNLTGGSLTGTLVLSADPLTSFEAATKNYVDSFVSGLIWIEPVSFINLIDDSLLSPPITPNISDIFVIPSVGVPSGAWTGLNNDDIVQWDGAAWILIDNLGSLITPTRFGIGFDTTSAVGGTFLGKKHQIAIYDPGLPGWTFEIPNQNNAVYVNNASSLRAFHQYAFDGTKWVLFAGGQQLISDDTTIIQTGNVLSTKPFSSGGTVDAATFQGKTPTDFIEVTGGTMTGTLVLDADPTANLEAATKQYVDNATSSASSQIIPYDMAFFVPDKPLDVVMIGSMLITRSVIINPPAASAPEGQSIAYAETEATSITVLDILVNETPIGTVTFSPGSKLGVIDILDTYVINAGETINVMGPPALDTTLENVRITLVGCSETTPCIIVTGYDITTTLFAGNSFDISLLDTTPGGIVFDPTGTKIFMTGTDNDSVYEINLIIPFDISTASYSGVSFSVTTQAAQPRAVEFSSDGTKMFVLDSTTDTVYLYNLSTPWDITSAVYSGTSLPVDAGAVITDPRSLEFSGDGLMLFVSGVDANLMVQYDLVSPWVLTGATLSVNQFDFNTVFADPHVIEFTPDGTKLFMVGDPSDEIFEFSLTTPFDITTMTFTGNTFDHSGEDGSGKGLTFNPNGSKMFLSADDNLSIFEYLLAPSVLPDLTCWEGTISTYDSVFLDLLPQTNDPEGIFFKPDGLALFVTTDFPSPDSVYEYSLTVPFDLTTATYSGTSYAVNPPNSGPAAIHISPDGTKLFDLSNTRVYPHTLSVPWDLTTATYDGVPLNVSAQMSFAEGIFFKPDGIKMYLLDKIFDRVHQYTLGTPWDVTTAVYDTVFLDAITESTQSTGLFINSDGDKVFISDEQSENVFRYSLGTPWDMSTATYDGVSFDISPLTFNIEDVSFSSDGCKMFVLDQGSSKRLLQYTISG